MFKSNNSILQREIIKENWEEHSYYDDAEHWIETFWADKSRFRIAFAALDKTAVLELACGRGRHAAQIVKVANGITLSDINQTNLDACQMRFKAYGNVDYHLTSGNDLSGIGDDTQTAVFCYDAMVHFELHDIAVYLEEIARVLCPGGQALLHYSNYSANPGGHYRDNPHWRSFCSEALFRHLAQRSGFDIISSEIFGWGEKSNYVAAIDALTLIQKPL